MLQTIETIASQVAQYAHRRQAEDDAARMKDQFVATVSHELRTPLTAIDGWLHIVLGGEPGPLTADQRRFLTTVKENSDCLMRLVGDLLLIGQIDAGHLIAEPSDVDIAALATETAGTFAKLAADKGVGIAADAGSAVIVRGDGLRLSQLLGNLVSNAVKFTPQGGRVSLRVAEQGTSCLIEVADTGIGIPAAERDHLFERFYRGATAREHGITGTGLGLAVCKAMAEAHQGTIRVADSDGGGTTFIVELPLAVRQEARL
jgi:signal transduction histidine kinase